MNIRHYRSPVMITSQVFFKKQWYIIFLTAILILARPAMINASPVDSLISKANQHYINLEFDQAAAIYRSVVDAGYESGELYYNLGNAYYKLNRLSGAILYYEKALELSPYDEDIRNNLEMANMLIVDQVETIPVFFLSRWWRLIVNLFSPDVWAVFSILLFLISLVLFFWRTLVLNSARTGKYLLPFGLMALFLSGLLYVFSISRKNYIVQNDKAVVMDLSVDVKSSPDEMGTSVFVLHEGTKVEIMDSLQNWREIKLANGNRGWVLKNSIGEI
ncbi:MAG: tetratricopeptide repeat protein [Bacteroidales bacterium]|nr:tetratricopeptide repeat protein [Bacteroidales bacterium]